MYSINTASLVNLLGFAVGLALYSLLLAMVVRHRRKDSKIDLLLLLTSALGIIWNAGELFAFVWKDFATSLLPPAFDAISYAALGFLPSVVVHAAVGKRKNSRIITAFAYGLSAFAALLHLHSAFENSVAPSNLALLLLTFGSIALIGGLLFLNYRQKIENKTVWTTALLIFSLSALHLSAKTEGNSWVIELISHQSSLPLVLAILFQHYRFAFADLFLKRALSLLILALTVFALFIFVAEPLRSLHLEHEEHDATANGILLVLWIATALFYPILHKASVWLVDNVLLKRVSYEVLQNQMLNEIEKIETVELVLDNVTQRLSEALTAKETKWIQIDKKPGEANLPDIDFAEGSAAIFIPTNESPFFQITMDRFSGGRRLLSDEIKMLEAVSLLTSRKIDALRVTHERCEQELREQEFSQLATEAQLTALRSQINPHFLFNALTTIGYLIQSSPEKALETLLRLTQLFRRLLKSGEEFCALGDEISLIENYLDIERVRFEERLQIEIDVPLELQNLRIPSLILQPLVENSIKHAISVNSRGGVVRVFAKIDLQDRKQTMVLCVFDSGRGGKTNGFAASEGIGLSNIRERLKTYYRDDATLKISSDDNGGTLAEIRFPVNVQENNSFRFK